MANANRDDAIISPFARYDIPKLTSFTVEDLRASIRRDLNALLNTVAFDATTDLEPYPDVRTSVLNFGLPDIAGQTYSRRAAYQRERDIEAVIEAFEPRLKDVKVTCEMYSDNPEELTYVIRGSITEAAEEMPVNYKSKLNVGLAKFRIED
ncbi:MAG: type VI secretion system baseplate subunit TssE [Pseudomonadota bacterium]